MILQLRQRSGCLDASGEQRVGAEPDFCQFDLPAIGRSGVPLPPPLRVLRSDGGFDEFRNEPIRDVVIGRINANESYRAAFRQAFPELKDDQAITFAMFGQAIAEFEFSITFMNAPIDRFARGESRAMTDAQKRGGVGLLQQSQLRAMSCRCGRIERALQRLQQSCRGNPADRAEVWRRGRVTCHSANRPPGIHRRWESGLRELRYYRRAQRHLQVPHCAFAKPRRSSRPSFTMAHSLV